MPISATNNLLDYISQTDIVTVTDSERSSMKSNFPKAFYETTTPYMSFTSPEVQEAIKDLRPR